MFNRCDPAICWFLFLCAVLVSGCGAPAVESSPRIEDVGETPLPDAESVDPDCLHIALRSGGLTLDPAMIGPDDYASSVLARQMYRGLVRPTPDGVEHDLAVGWSSEDEGWTWDFFLDQEATFHDGTRITAGLIREQWISELRTDSDSPLAACLLNAADIRAPADDILRFHLSHPDGQFPSAVATCPNMLVSGPSTGEVPLGTGSYRYGGLTPEGVVILRAVGRQDFRSLVFHPLPPDLDLGEPETWDPEIADILESAGAVMYLRPGEASAVALRLGMYVDAAPAFNVRGLVLNDGRDPLCVGEVRRAIFCAVGDSASLFEDAEEHSRHLLPILTWLPSGHALGDLVSQPMSRPRDPERAEALLESAGLWRGEDGFWVTGGIADLPMPVNLEMIAPEGVYAGGEIAAGLISDRLTEAGFRVQTEVLPWVRFLSRYFPGEYDLALVGWSEHSPVASAFLFPWFHSNGGVTINAGDRLGLDSLLLSARSEMSEDERAAKYAEVLDTAAEASLLLPLYTTPALHALRGDLRPCGPFPSFSRDE
ncbi:MAG: ABC transporter substrate-binding protein [Bacillota bacterium]